MKTSLRCGQQYDRQISLTLRALQFATCAVALALVAASFEARTLRFHAQGGAPQQMTVYYGGPAVNFVLLVSFAAVLYDGFWLLLVFALRCASMPAPWSFGVDAVFTMLFMSAGCALAACDYVRYCDALDGVVRCALLASAAALCFMAFVSFLLSVAWGAWMRNTWVKPRRKDPLSHVARTELTTDPVPGDLELDLERAATYESSTYVQDGFRQA
ncbi:Marvel domain [Phytophthora cinnamomi]|uniref:Marvel domain n=1 Tax=Phytophthora cinnamomi TaxID=4785 RepID=UPI00355A4ECB|nr:Marvel domain [Phytophthora cinnamomi]